MEEKVLLHAIQMLLMGASRIDARIKIKIYRFIVVLSAIGWLMAPAAVVSETQTVNELFQSNVVYTQEADEIQLTLRPEYQNSANGDHWLLLVGAEYGFTDALQAEVAWTAYERDDPDSGPSTDGVGDFFIALQHSWLNVADEPLQVAISLELVLDTGNDELELSEEGTVWEPSLIIASSPSYLMGIEAFVEIGSEISSEESETFFNIGGYYRAFDNQLLSLEYNYEEEERYLTPGISRRWQNGWEAGMGIPVGVNDDADDFRVIFLLIYEG